MKGLFTPKDREEKEDKMYTKKVMLPQYNPSETSPTLSSVMDTRKYGQLVHNIKESNLPEEEKQFLLLAATRHIVFNYSRIADYYAHASKEMQELMEQSALVILDVNDAIANGYVVLTDKIKHILEESGVKPGDNNER